jgi:type II secretory pathway component GspD/PulD (secretin)
MDSPSYYNATVKYIEEFDVPPEMVRIDANIVEVEMNDDFNFGLALEAWKEALPEAVDMQLDFAQSKDRADLNMEPGSWAQYAAQSISIQGMRPKAMANFINYLVRTGKAKVLSRPTVVAMNGQEATIASLDKVSYKAYSTPDTPLNKQSDVGVALTITPTIGSQTLSLAIDASVNSLVGWTSANDPIINTRSTTANVVLQDGELFSLSGLRKDVVTKQDERVPILGSTPLIGYLFRHEIDVKTTSEIVVLLTPHKVTPKTSVLDRERELLQSTNAEVTAPPPPPMDQFINRVILNKKP